MRAPLGTWPLGMLVVAAACSGRQGEEAPGQASARKIECALAGATAFASDCTLEEAASAGARYVIVHRPDGGFRRFERGADGGLSLADGSGAAKVTAGAGTIEIAVGQDRYRIPAPPVASHAR